MTPALCKASPLWLCLCLLVHAALAEDRALLIGINHYHSPDIRRLYGTHNDVAAVHTLLTGRLGFRENQIRELKDQDATKDGILAAMDQWLIRDTAPGERVVFYYSGHGDQIADQPGGDEQEDHLDEALIAYDAVRDGGNWVRDDDIDARLRQLADREVLAVFDSCHSGTVTRAAVGDEDAKTPGWQAGTATTRTAASKQRHQQEGGFIDGSANLTAFFAVAPEQKALEDKHDPSHPHGVFTAAFVDGVNGEADANADGAIAYAELFDYLRVRSRHYCETRRQTQGKCVLGLTPLKQYDDTRAARNFLDFGRAPEKAGAVPNASVATVSRARESAPAPATEPLTALDPTALLAHGNDAGLGLAIEPASRVQLGQAVRYRVQVPRRGKLLLLDIDAAGQATLLYPNDAISPSAPSPCRPLPEVVAGGREVLIPDNCMGFAIQAQEPAGNGKLIALLIEDLSVEIRDPSPAHPGLARTTDVSEPAPPPFAAIPQPVDWMALLRSRLDRVFHEPDGRNREVRWSVTAIDYEIVR